MHADYVQSVLIRYDSMIIIDFSLCSIDMKRNV